MRVKSMTGDIRIFLAPDDQVRGLRKEPDRVNPGLDLVSRELEVQPFSKTQWN